jgi:hypothetical protein
MLDIIFNSRIYDIGAFYNFGDTMDEFVQMTRTRNSSITTFFERHGPRMQRGIDAVISAMQLAD